ncbi:MAG: M15 family metallopeptidase [Clostridia bacterium]|nr:M15 family metallopeptidase [Clostridia bacterium]
MRKTRVKNKKRFIIAIIILLLIVALVVALVDFIVKRSKAKTGPLGDEDYTSTGSAITSGELSKEEQERLDKELAREKEVASAKEKINSMTYPISEVEDFNLILVNKTHGLSDKYKPDDLVTVDRFVAGVGNNETHMLRKVAADALNKMFDAAEAEGIELRLRTGFRSYSYQTSLYDSYVKKDGKKEADTYSARPGYSEHQSGLACDLGGKSQGFALSYQFGETEEGKWVAAHAHEYGFIIRFTDGKTVDGKRMPGEITGYVFEPWHIRYVGLDHAMAMSGTDKSGSLLTLEEYLGIVDEAEYIN